MDKYTKVQTLVLPRGELFKADQTFHSIVFDGAVSGWYWNRTETIPASTNGFVLGNGQVYVLDGPLSLAWTGQRSGTLRYYYQRYP